MDKLTHLDAQGTARMVDVGDKPETDREARAEAWVRMSEQTLSLIESGGHRKGDVIAVARIAGIQAAKRCAELIPLCHPLMLTGIDVDIDVANATLTLPGGRATEFPIDAFARYCLVEGIDQLGYLRKHLVSIEAFEESRTWTP